MDGESGDPEPKDDILKHSAVDVNSMYITTMQEHFIPPRLPKCRKGTRKEAMEKLLWEKIAKEMEAQKVHTDDKHYDTEYTVKFGAEGFVPKPMKINKELHVVYPLYLDTAKTVWLDRFNKLEGVTKTHSTNYRDFFKKNTNFSKPLDENLDDM